MSVHPIQSYPKMSDKRRKAILNVWGGVEPMHEVLTALHFLDCHMPGEKLDEALFWMLRNGVTGKKFQDYFKSDCAGSHLELLRNLTMRIEKEKSTRALYAGKDVSV